MKDRLQGVGRLAKAGVAILFMMVGAQAMANLAADHIVRNSATVAFADANNVTVPYDALLHTATVDITIKLVQAAPDVALNTTLTGSLAAISTNSTVTLHYDVTSKANGYDTYELLPGLTINSGTGTSEGTIGAAVELGATVAAAAATGFSVTDVTDSTDAGTAITVAADSLGNDGNHNKLAVGDTVVVFADTTLVCKVNHVDESGTTDIADFANATDTIWVDLCKTEAGVNAAGSETLAIGGLIGERQQITVDIGVGSTAATVEVIASFDATVAGTPDAAAIAAAQVDITVVSASLAIYKFVRNVDGGAGDACSSTLACVSQNGLTYYRTGVTAAPGTDLEYAILLINTGTIDAKNVILTDDVPITSFVTYNANSIQLVTQVTPATAFCADTTCAFGSPTLVSAEDTVFGADGDFGEFQSNTVTVSAGATGAGLTDPEADTLGGQIDAGNMSLVIFQVTVD